MVSSDQTPGSGLNLTGLRDLSGLRTCKLKGF